MNKKILLSILVIVGIFITGCSKEKYNIKIDNLKGSWIATFEN